MAKSVLNMKKTKLFPLYFISAALVIALGVMLLPVFSGTELFFADWGSYAVNLLICAALILYIFLYLVRALKRARRESVRMLIVVEIVLFSIIALGTVLEQFNVIKLGGPCVILGVAVWLRGVVGAVGGYLYRHTSEEKRYGMIEFLVSILLVTLGTALVVRPFFTERDILWILSVALIISGALLAVVGIVSMPEKKKIAKTGTGK